MKRTRGLGGIFQRGERWWIVYHVHGKRYRESSNSDNRSDAVRLLKQKISKAQLGKPVGPQVEKTTLEDVLTMVLDDYRARGRRSAERAIFAFPHLRRFFGPDARALEITTDRVTAYRAERQQEGAAATVNYECAVLRRGFRLALEAGKVAATPRIQTPNPHNVRQGFFEVDQYRAVLAQLPEHLRPVVQAAYLTGWRARSELLTRQWRHVDLNAGWLRLEPGESKNGEGRNFPLTPDLRALFEAQREHVRELERAQGRIIPWVFPGPDGSRIDSFNWYWNRACHLAGVPGRLIHDLRRTAVRDFERCGVPRSAAMKLTGHKTEAVYARYAIVDSAMLQEAAAKLAAFHDAASATPATKKIVPLVGESK